MITHEQAEQQFRAADLIEAAVGKGRWKGIVAEKLWLVEVEQGISIDIELDKFQKGLHLIGEPDCTPEGLYQLQLLIEPNRTCRREAILALAEGFEPTEDPDVIGQRLITNESLWDCISQLLDKLFPPKAKEKGTKSLLLASLLLVTGAQALPAQTPNRALPKQATAEQTAATSTGRRIVLSNSDDGQSELTVYLPAAEATGNNIGRSIVGCPGGGYSHLSMANEGHDWAEFYNAQGIAYAVLQYRMPAGDRTRPLGDAYRAIRTLRDSAQVWHLDPQNVGIQGFSAGGHLASAVSTHAPADARPDFSILFYPVISIDERLTHRGSCVGFLGEARRDSALVREWSSDQAVDSLTPPALLILASDDRAVPPLTNALPYYTALLRAGRSAALLCYPTGGHGFGFRSSFPYHEVMKAEIRQWLSQLAQSPAKESAAKD